VLYSNRGLLQRTIFEYASGLGIKFRLGCRVTKYFEEDNYAGVYVGDERIEGDAVIAADGVHSTARKHVIGIQQHPRTSGFAVYRTSFPLERLADNPLTKPFAESKRDIFKVW